MFRRTTTALTLTAAALALPALASADSIVYIDGGNVWSASPDGARKVQLTDGGGWHSPTQADDGTLAAVQGAGAIQLMARDGRPIRSITTKPARTGNGGWFRGTPVNLSLSPDGSKIAYEYSDLACPPASTCGQQNSVFYTATNVTEATPQETYGNQFGAAEPEWVSNSKTVVTLGSTLAFDVLGGGDYSMERWFSGSTDFSDAEFTRDGRRVAFNVGYGASKQLGFTVSDGTVATGTPARPEGFACAAEADPKLGDVTWAPSGEAAAYESSAGIETVRFGRFAIGDCEVLGAGVLTPTGTEPDWGPADPAGSRYAAAPTGGGGGTTTAPGATTPPGGGAAPGGGPTSGGGKGPGAAGGGGAAAPLRLTVSAPTWAALRKGLGLTVAAPTAGTVRATLTLRGARLATGTARAPKAGRVTLRLSRLSPRRAASLKGKSVRLTVTAGGRTSSRTLRVR